MNIIKQLRKEKGITQEELGKIINVQKSAISKYETGRATPDLETIKTLANFFNVSIDYLLNNNIEETSNKKKPKDLAKFLDDTEIMFDGEIYKLSDADKQKLRNALEFVFWDAKKENKRKK